MADKRLQFEVISISYTETKSKNIEPNVKP